MWRPKPEQLLPARPASHDRSAARLQQFLNESWGRRAHCMRQVMAPPADLIDGDELAGLACEDDADARLIERAATGFRQRSGPFREEDFGGLGDTDWTLLVNGVNLKVPGLEPMLRQLRFVPDWRIDDAMVSFAAPGGSAGPHYDHYDVFLVQLAGRRRWELGADCNGPEHPVDAQDGLSLVADFQPAETLWCEPGDVLYVPPGLVHHGIAETPCLTLSLGLRAPSTQDLLAAFVEHCSETASPRPLQLDPPLPAAPLRLQHETVAQAREQLRAALLAGLDDPGFTNWLGAQLSQPSRGLLLDEPAPLEAQTLRRELAAGARLEPLPGVRLLLVAEPGGTPVLCAGGECYPLVDIDPATTEQLIARPDWGSAELNEENGLALAARLYNDGWLTLFDPG